MVWVWWAIRGKEYILTISFGPIFEAKGEGKGGIVLEELSSEGIPPQVVRLLQGNKTICELQSSTTKAGLRADVFVV